MSLMIKPGMEWKNVEAEVKALIPEAYDSQGKPLNLVKGEWSSPGWGKHSLSPIDGTGLATFPMLGLDEAREATEFAAREFIDWRRVDLDERKRRVTAVLAGMKKHRDLFAKVLVWEIGKTFATAQTSVDRCISGVEWYVENIESMVIGREPIGLISNIASWNYPLSVLFHAVLVQLLAGNSVIAKTPSDGGLTCLTLAFALARREKLPVSLVSGSGGQLSDALVKNNAIACLAFVGGKSNGGVIAASLYDQNKRYMLEMEGVNAYGIWDFTQWDLFKQHLKKGYEYGKQRCTAYVRYVVQRDLFPKFLDAYLSVVKTIRVGNPVLVGNEKEPLPSYDFGPVINAKKVEELRVRFSEAVGKGATCLFESALQRENFLPNQDIASYFLPTALLNVPRNCELYHSEPFGPIDTIVVVDRVEELAGEMNASNGSLVATIASDNPSVSQRIRSESRAFKVGVNALRSRGDREEPFGGRGNSWRGCFVGGKYLVESVTTGDPGEKLFGIFPDYTRVPDEIAASETVSKKG